MAKPEVGTDAICSGHSCRCYLSGEKIRHVSDGVICESNRFYLRTISLIPTRAKVIELLRTASNENGQLHATASPSTETV